MSHKLLNAINIKSQVYLLGANWLPKNNLPFFAAKIIFWLSLS